ncbi:thioredoxin H-type [Ricinus communis]|uniref:Thioredoxin H-type, putative n=1 Tax=Ricinus communis TaxID=3988 RepID=B9RGZ1_RICCO|nr:thioredoxin H-type [Ricinus communis]XP_015570784.1 thioredoxin H-type [Ricinus communis]XP_015570785.1 thioredoxin H-type [Ricinus communis]EEF49353.1 Thioredoxin H-type, putative [Ricinus communis]|eukprot:XP_002512850.1 thioredoxin H-type [Ricinus communis]
MGHCWSKVCMCCHNINNADGKVNNNQTDHINCTCQNVHRINTIQKWEQMLSEATRDSKIIIVNFCSSWCSPSKSIAPLYCDLANKNPSMTFLSIDIDELREPSSTWEVKSTPTFFFLKNGRQLDKLVGANKPELQKKISAVTSLANGLKHTGQLG